MTANLKPEERDVYDQRFQSFLSKIIEVAGYSSRRKYLYPIIQGVPLKDLEVALDMAMLERTKKKANDNGAK